MDGLKVSFDYNLNLLLMRGVGIFNISLPSLHYTTKAPPSPHVYNNIEKLLLATKQIHGQQLRIHLTKTQSTAVEMFYTVNRVHFWTKLEETCTKWTNCNVELEKQYEKDEFCVAI